MGPFKSLTSRDLKIFLDTFLENIRNERYLSKYRTPPDNDKTAYTLAYSVLVKLGYATELH